MIETKYIDDPEAVYRTAAEFLVEFIEHVYPAYSLYGMTVAEALTIWKLNIIYNQLCNLQDTLGGDKEDWQK